MSVRVLESRPVKSECLAAPRVKGKKTFCVLVSRASWLPGHIIQGMVSVAEELTIVLSTDKPCVEH